MALTAKGRATRQRIIEGAAAYLRSDDPAGVTLDDIRAITGTSKSQIFHYFPDGKAELLLAVARYEADRVIDDQQPHLGALSSWAAWKRWRDSVVARYRAQGRSCPLGALMGQVGTTPGAADVVTALLAQWQAHIRRGITDMQAAGLVRGGLDADCVASAFIAGIQGGVQVLRSTGGIEHLEATLDTLIDHLRGA
ncbi:TetR/AcrR family transcriptional regulator [Actinoallomurus purpureus]|uniref:TetR/AcrR family transcriptional regulator n=1 Tax=Actinoallomurus purpureus TaxID=478114 RepID=UPI002093474A|nr:TetR/AcrR family transcriptional regulator [Actinoallomurus purpureus]MCO6008640.1 TetR/AcrR family transcriptional regulator [Actinoallomurus purpureus]